MHRKTQQTVLLYENNACLDGGMGGVMLHDVNVESLSFHREIRKA